jgi:hypothetical protein
MTPAPGRDCHQATATQRERNRMREATVPVAIVVEHPDEEKIEVRQHRQARSECDQPVSVRCV